jgi:hypothetical protein
VHPFLEYPDEKPDIELALQLSHQLVFG